MSARRQAIIGGVKVRGLTIVENQDYENMKNKPSINGVPLVGDLSSEDLHIEGGGGGEGTKYAFAEGDVKGAFEVTPKGGEAQTVKVHGLQDICFEEALSEEEILTILNADEAEDDTE